MARTIYSEQIGTESAPVMVTVSRDRLTPPGQRYRINGRVIDFTELTEDALLAILLDRAKMADAKNETKENAKRVTMLKKLKSGDDERGRATG